MFTLINIKRKECEDCGGLDKESNPVTYYPDPFNDEVYGNEEYVWMCANCRCSSANEI